jgi:gliding motility-associated-like protein
MDTINLTSGITAYDDNLNVLIDYENPNEGLVCYTVRARENTNIHGIQGISLSNQVCFSINPEVRIPNAFIPNDAEVVNQVFEPVFSFLPEHYEITIFNRLGTKVWEGSEPWDGKVNGKYVPEGVYLYYIRVFSFSAKITEYNGKVTVLYR